MHFIGTTKSDGVVNRSDDKLRTEAIDKLVMGYGRTMLLNETFTPYQYTENDIDAFASEQGLGRVMPKQTANVYATADCSSIQRTQSCTL